jgi:hypothetical protein
LLLITSAAEAPRRWKGGRWLVDEYIITLIKLIAAFASTVASAKAVLAYARRLGWI